MNEVNRRVFYLSNAIENDDKYISDLKHLIDASNDDKIGIKIYHNMYDYYVKSKSEMMPHIRRLYLYYLSGYNDLLNKNFDNFSIYANDDKHSINIFNVNLGVIK